MELNVPSPQKNNEHQSESAATATTTFAVNGYMNGSSFHEQTQKSTDIHEAASVNEISESPATGVATTQKRSVPTNSIDDAIVQPPLQKKKLTQMSLLVHFSNGHATNDNVNDKTEEVSSVDSPENVNMEPHEKETAETEPANGMAMLTEDDKRAREEFLRNLKAGDPVDVFCVRTKKWLPAKIQETVDNGFKVHYMGWSHLSDEMIEKYKFRIAPKASEASLAWEEYEKPLEKRKRNREQKTKVAAQATLKKNSLTNGVPDLSLASVFVEAGLTRSGRKITKRVVSNGSVNKPPKVVVKKKKPAVDEPISRGIPEDDLCGTCGQIEDEDLTDMILCDGGCLTSYHFSCQGLEAAPEEEKWLCEQCRTNEQKCFACGRNDTIGEKGGVFRCSVSSCGKFFHQSCVNKSKLSRRPYKQKTASAGEADEDELLEFDAPFRCPRHVCSVCEDVKKGVDLMCCLQCPESYHPHCVPPSARYNSIALLCSRHPHDKLPKIPDFYFTDENCDTITVDGSLHFPMLFLPKIEPDADKKDDYHHFRLLLQMVEDVKQQPPTYRKLVRSIYTFKQPKVSLEDSPMCVCKEKCGDDCINRLSFTECFGPAPTPGMKFNKQNRESNCMLGEQCGNRALHQRVYPRFERFHTTEKGWALRVLEPVKAGQLVIEYVGEVINEEEKERRLRHHAENTPEDKNMYIMELGKGIYIDARFKGSVSRFINHSCDPNCHLLKWKVKGVDRIAITALKDIEPGTELSYDYQFHTKQAMEWKCHCQAKNCRGTMAPEKLNQADGLNEPEKKLTKKEKMKKMKRALMQEKIQQDKEVKATARRLSLTYQVSVGGVNAGDKTLVRTGPAQRELNWVRGSRVFLARNATLGFDFLRRKQLKDRKIKRTMKKIEQNTLVEPESVLQENQENGVSVTLEELDS